MKKTSLIILSIASSVLLFSCKKKEKEPEAPALINTSMADGLPENYKSINGYLFAGVQTYQYSGSNINYYTFSYAAFCDPTKNLLSSYNHYTDQKNFSGNIPFGNIDVGNVTFNGGNIFKSSSGIELFYGGNNFSNTTNFLNYNAVWSTDGNKTFKPLNLTINKGLPIIVTSALNIPSSISKNSNYTINIGNNISNYDSLIVTFEDGNYSKIRKVIPKNATSVTFTTQEMSILYTSNYARINICAYNYSNMTIDSKINVFELSNQYYINNIYLY